MYLKKLNDEKTKARKFLHAQAAARRKDKLIESKNSQISMLTDQLHNSRDKADKAQEFYRQNQHLVTRKCALESALQMREKQVNDLTDKVRSLEDMLRGKEGDRHKEKSETMQTTMTGGRDQSKERQAKNKFSGRSPAQNQPKVTSIVPTRSSKDDMIKNLSPVRKSIEV